MQLEPPTRPRVYVQMVDPDGKERGRSLTLYDTTPAAAHDAIKRFVKLGGTQPVSEGDARLGGKPIG